jgi:glutathione S-transferase
MVVYGHPKCIDTAKCFQTAAEKGVDIEAKVIDPAANGGDAEFRSVSPLGTVPALRDIKYTVYGTLAVMSYLDDKGFGPSLVPRNGVQRAIMYQWAGIAMDIVQEHIAGGAFEKLAPVFDAFDKQINNPPKRGDFICGDFTLADIHWSACVNMLHIKGQADMVNSKPAIASWFEKVKQHPSTSKEKIIPFTTIPTADDVQQGKLRDISINV